MSNSELRAAIASEFSGYDLEIYRRLLERTVDRNIRAFESDLVFSGCQSVRTLAAPFLTKAWSDGVRHALIAVDNDGGGRRRPEHEDDHDEEKQNENPNDACRICWLRRVLPSTWQAQGGARCLVVPVQTIETWLLYLRGHEFPGTGKPEQRYDRRALKRDFFGTLSLPRADQLKLALAEVERPNALERLRDLRSFKLFEVQAAAWRSPADAETAGPT